MRVRFGKLPIEIEWNRDYRIYGLAQDQPGFEPRLLNRVPDNFTDIIAISGVNSRSDYAAFFVDVRDTLRTYSEC